MSKRIDIIIFGQGVFETGNTKDKQNNNLRKLAIHYQTVCGRVQNYQKLLASKLYWEMNPTKRYKYLNILATRRKKIYT